MKDYLDTLKFTALWVLGVIGALGIPMLFLTLAIEVSAWFAIPLAVALFLGLSLLVHEFR